MRRCENGLRKGPRPAAAAFLLLGLIVLPVVAFAGEATRWTIVEASGEARVGTAGGAWQAAAGGAVLTPGSRLETGPDGRVVLSADRGSIVVSPASRMTVPDGSSGARSSILQTLGTLLFRIQKRPEQHFQVDTPYLATVVKGTTFTVTVNPEGAAVHVTEGAVQVRAIDSGQSALIRPGQTATVSAVRGSTLSIIGRAREGRLRRAPDEKGAAAGTGAERGAETRTGDGAAPVRTETRTKAARAAPAGKRAVARSAPVAAKPLLVPRPVGEARLDIVGVTKGLARSADGAGRAGASVSMTPRAGAAARPTIEEARPTGVRPPGATGKPPVRAVVKRLRPAGPAPSVRSPAIWARPPLAAVVAAPVPAIKPGDVARPPAPARLPPALSPGTDLPSPPATPGTAIGAGPAGRTK